MPNLLSNPLFCPTVVAGIWLLMDSRPCLPDLGFMMPLAIALFLVPVVAEEGQFQFVGNEN
ncbi:hypothetical protein RchiOBHm_Chr1g0374501 [Rosa chinensis]|uniref:Uncharacterized protein n=1 Tax=Rosa chinensis TaxID=74649 RepID=A0A2P6SME0_ROSCH|nr:hypothetical protein RchiOBHm_Chr1g0374501 [Rosa chinensis]